MSELAPFIAERLKEQRRTQTELIDYLGDLLTKSPETARKWIVGRSKRAEKMPYEALEPIADFLKLENVDRLELYRLAGYPVPSWLTPKHDMYEHGGLTLEECRVTRLNTMDEVYKFVLEQIEQATEKVCDLTWGHSRTRTESERLAYEAYMQSILGTCDKGIEYREVMTFHTTYRHYLNRAKIFLQANKLSYGLRFYESPSDLSQMPPLLSFLIIDDRIVITCLYSDPVRPRDKEIRLAIQQPLIIKQFQDYFDEIWQHATHLKDGEDTDWEAFDQLEARYATGPGTSV